MRECFFRILLTALIGRLCFNEKTITAASGTYEVRDERNPAILLRMSPGRHNAVVRWKLYSSYYYIFYFRFSLLISNTYFTHVHILNILYSTTHTLRTILSVYRQRIIKSYIMYIVYILSYIYTSLFTYKHLHAYPENDIILFSKMIKIHNIILKIYYIVIDHYLNTISVSDSIFLF